MGASRHQIIKRRAAALALAAALTAGIAVLVLGGSGDGAPESPKGVSKRALAEARKLSTGEQVDQVLLAGVPGTSGAAATPALGSHQLGGVLIGPENWRDPQQGKHLAAAITKAGASGGRIPPLLAASQVGGDAGGLAGMPPARSELALGDAGDPSLAERSAAETGRALAEMGIRLNLAPAADVSTIDSPLGDRSYSDDPNLAAAMSAAAVQGCASAQIACAPGRFPGLGATNQDTDNGPATVSLGRAELADRDLIPFRTAFRAGAPAVVVSVALYAAYDAVTPAALTPEVTTGLLRDQLGFRGVAISDDLDTGAVRSANAVGEAAVQALAAGCDMVQVSHPEDVGQARSALVKATDDGTLSRDRLAAAVARVLDLKRSLGILR